MRRHPTIDYFDQVKAILHGHRGRQNAITIEQLCMKVGCMKLDPDIQEPVPDRRVMEELLETRNDDFPFIVAGSARGMYVVVEADELNHHLDRCQGRCIKLFLRKRTDINKALRAGFQRVGKRFINPPAVPPPPAPVQAELSLSSLESPSSLRTPTTQESAHA